jgi:hypothetical protein
MPKSRGSKNQDEVGIIGRSAIRYVGTQSDSKHKKRQYIDTNVRILTFHAADFTIPNYISLA